MIVMACVVPVKAADKAGLSAWGPIEGRVLDATTLMPIEGAQVETWYENRTPDQDQELGLTCLTDSAGRYQVRALVGTVQSNVDLGRVLTTSLAGLLAGGLTGGLNKSTNAVCVDGVPLKVSYPGYKPLSGHVPLEMIFAAKMLGVPRTILLVPAAGAGQSYWQEASGGLQVEGLSEVLTGAGPFPVAVTWPWPSQNWPGCKLSVWCAYATTVGGESPSVKLQGDKGNPTDATHLAQRWEGSLVLPKSGSRSVEVIRLHLVISDAKDSTTYADETYFVGGAADSAEAGTAQALATACANPKLEEMAAGFQLAYESSPNCAAALSSYASAIAPDRAVALVEAAPETLRSDSSVDLSYVGALAKTGQFDKVVSHLASTQLTRDDARNYVLGWALIMTGQREAGKRLVDKDKYSPGWWPWGWDGWWAWEVGKWEEIVAKKPQDAGATLKLSEALYHVGRLDESREAFDRALALQPSQDDAESIGLLLADVLKATGRADDALAVQQALVKCCPDSSRGWEALLTTLSSGPPAPLAEACAQCLSTKAVCDLAYFYTGRAQEEAGQLEEALATYEAGSQKAESSFMLYHASACLQARRGKWAEAGALFQKAAEHGFGDAASRFDHPEMPAMYLGPQVGFAAPIWTQANLTSINGFGSRTAQADCYLAAMAPEVMSPPTVAPAGTPAAEPTATAPLVEAETVRRYLVGKSLTVVGLVPQALQVLQPLAQQCPDSPDILLALADAELAAGNVSGCSQALATVEALLPGNAEVSQRRCALAEQ